MEVCKYTLDTFCLISQYNLFFFTPYHVSSLCSQREYYFDLGIICSSKNTGVYLCEILDSQMKEHIFAYLALS